ncbi:type IV secretory system conjugative DNA transfer family protein, partial [Fusobacterium sp.]|uniref:type IV secretory system conjugative DNA transfer family protein n=1 Tax=Fusobacterium sp. TaxID=68766 RepID=UPI002900BE2D
MVVSKKKTLDSHGSAEWATLEEIKEMNLYNEAGAVLGKDSKNRILRTLGVEHILMAAPTRGGKGINTVTPTCLDWTDSMIINDIKGELWGLTAGYRKNILGQKVIHFNPIDTEGISCSYNPLDFIKKGTAKEMQDIEVIVKTLLDSDGKGESDHWVGSAMNFLTGVIFHLIYAKENANLGDVIDFLTDSEMPLINRIADIMGFPHPEEEEPSSEPFNHLWNIENKNLFKEIYGKEGSLHPNVASEFSTVFALPDKERGSVISSATRLMKIFLDPLLRKHISKSDFTVQDIMNTKTTLYLVTPPEAIDRTRPLLRLIITQAVYGLTKPMKFDNKQSTLMEKILKPFKDLKKKMKSYFFTEPKKNRILFLIDEFPSLGKLELVESSMSYIAGYGLKMLLITQSMKQLKKIYGKDNFILANCSIQLYLTPNEIDDAEDISKALDNKTILSVSVSKKGFDLFPSKTISETGRRLMTAGEVRILPFENIIIFVSGQKPIYGNKLMYYKEKRYNERLLPTPQITDTFRKEEIKEKSPVKK